MFHPVGPQPPSVYWRRRLVFVAAGVGVLVLIVMTLKIVTSGGDSPAGAQGTSPTTTSRTSASSSLPVTSPAKSRVSSSRPRSSSHSSTPTHSTTPPTPACTTAQLAVAAVTGKSDYRVGDQPLLELQVTNSAGAPCVQDLADAKVELKVYNGESRVWGSHDCKVQPGTAVRTLAPHVPVLVAITWSGLSSQPGCAGTRQRVGAGSYTLYATLAGKTGKAAQFSIG
jgi:hypothetical protein